MLVLDGARHLDLGLVAVVEVVGLHFQRHQLRRGLGPGGLLADQLLRLGRLALETELYSSRKSLAVAGLEPREARTDLLGGREAAYPLVDLLLPGLVLLFGNGRLHDNPAWLA